MILATDNTTVKSAFYKGNTSSKTFYDLVVRFRVLEIEHGDKLFITHVSGNRTKVQGTDGVSRDQICECVSIRAVMLTFVHGTKCS